MKERLKQLMRIPLYPILRYFGPRFLNVYARLDTVTNHVLDVNNRLATLEGRAATNLDTISEIALYLQRTAGTIDERSAALANLLTSNLGKQLIETDQELADYGAHLMVGRTVEGIGAGTADLINWAGGHKGIVAQAGLWFNPAVSVQVRPGKVTPASINERIVEIPYAMGVAADLPLGSRVLDVGSAESTLALSLASLGLNVTAIDPRGYPFEHPRLSIVEEPIERWAGPDTSLDAIFCISTIEHLGIGAYGQSHNPNLDRQVMERFYSYLASDGQLVLTTPYGRWSVDQLQRVYDDQHLDPLLEGWKIMDRRVCVQTSDLRWETHLEEPESKAWDSRNRAVVLIRAAPE